jgi:hypothetical protein
MPNRYCDLMTTIAMTMKTTIMPMSSMFIQVANAGRLQGAEETAVQTASVAGSATLLSVLNW